MGVWLWEGGWAGRGYLVALISIWISVMIMLCILPLTSCCPKREKSCYDGFQEEGKLGAAWFPLQKLLLMHHGSFKVLSASLKLYTQYNTSLLINSPHYICNDAAFSVVYHHQDRVRRLDTECIFWWPLIGLLLKLKCEGWFLSPKNGLYGPLSSNIFCR